jgi:integrase
VSSGLADRLRERTDKGLILLMPDGSHISRRWFRRRIWVPALKAAGLEESGFAPRDLRRTSASWIRAGGGSLESVQNRLGHGSLATTSR